MVRRGAHQALGHKVDQSEGQRAGLEGNLEAVGRRRFRLGDGQHAHRDERAIRTAIALLSVRAARHIPGHRDHVAHLACRQPLCGCRCDQWRSSQPNNYKDREQATDVKAKIHDPTSHMPQTLERTIGSHSRYNFGYIRMIAASPVAPPHYAARFPLAVPYPGIKEAPGGHPGDLEPEQPGS